MKKDMRSYGKMISSRFSVLDHGSVIRRNSVGGLGISIMSKTFYLTRDEL